MDDLQLTQDESDELFIEAIDLSGIDVLEEDIVPCTCCGSGCGICC
jgi:hypothetical protein